MVRHVRVLVTLLALVVAGSAHVSGYTVRRGDTLSDIASRLGVRSRDLATANGIPDADRLREGRRLVVPTGASPRRSWRPVPVASRTELRSHVVGRGENLTSIARRYGTTVKALTGANGLDRPNRVRRGQRLLVPTSAEAPVQAVSDVPAARCPVKGADRWAFVDSFGAPRPGYRRHAGIDIFARRGTPVVAPMAGVVKHVSNPIGGLAFELVAADGTRFYGAHLAALAKPGRVPAGAVIGTVGTSGNAAGTPAHLHLEWYPKGRGRANPYGALRTWCS